MFVFQKAGSASFPAPRAAFQNGAYAAACSVPAQRTHRPLGIDREWLKTTRFGRLPELQRGTVMGTTRPIDPDLRPAEHPLTQPTALTPLGRALVSCPSPNFHGKKE